MGSGWLEVLEWTLSGLKLSGGLLVWTLSGRRLPGGAGVDFEWTQVAWRVAEVDFEWTQVGWSSGYWSGARRHTGLLYCSACPHITRRYLAAPTHCMLGSRRRGWAGRMGLRSSDTVKISTI